MDPLRAAGLRRTPARTAVWREIAQRGRPLSHAELRRSLPDLDEVTIYRAVAALEGAGLVHRVQGIDGVWRASANAPDAEGCPGNHVHLLCTGCGAMSCLRDQEMPRVAVPPGFVVEGRHFVVWGRCGACPP